MTQINVDLLVKCVNDKLVVILPLKQPCLFLLHSVP